VQMADLLRVGGGTLMPSALAADLAPGVTGLVKAARGLLGNEAQAQSARLRGELALAGAPEREAAMVAHLHDMDGAVGIARLAQRSGVAPTVLATAFVDLGARLGLDWAQGAAARLNPSDTWDRLLVAGLARDFQQMRLDFLARAGAGKGNGKSGAKAGPGAAVAEWAEAQASAVRQFRALIARAQASVTVSPAMLAQLASQARNLLAK